MRARAAVPAVGEILNAGGAEIEDARSDAARRADKIRALTFGIADDLARLRTLVHEAKAADDHLALGYPSWTAYLADLFGAEPLQVARDVRQELVAELAAQGMSTRAIAPIVGVTKSQVSRDLAGFPDPEPLIEVPAEVSPDGASVAVVVVAEPAPIKGLDGKNYTRPPKREAPPERPVTVITAAQRVAGAVGLIDQTVYANEDNGPDVVWTTPEVMDLLAEIRRALTGETE